MHEVKHIISILKKTQKALHREDAQALKQISNQTLHSSVAIQDDASIAFMIIVYTLAKLVERKHYLKIKNWKTTERRIHNIFNQAIQALKQNDNKRYQAELLQARKTLESVDVNLKDYVRDLLNKASINKASRMYEHGLSRGKTAELLGISQWELTEYTGQTSTADIKQNRSISTKQRAQQALEFFS
jgi:predicted transcriptional regulator